MNDAQMDRLLAIDTAEQKAKTKRHLARIEAEERSTALEQLAAEAARLEQHHALMGRRG